MKLDYTLPGVMTQSSGLDTPTNNFLPQRVVDVPKDVMRSFPHSKRVGNYLLGKTLGEGSFAKVKEALHTLTGEKVAVKVIDKKKAKEDVYVRKNLRREGKLLQIVRHRHVIQLLEIMETENSYYLVTELCQGGDLMDLICSNKRLDESQTRKYIKQISSAVDYLHKAGILHRDLKVENLLLDHNKDIKIIDFGLSNSVRVSHTKDGGSQAQEYCVTQCGSPAYAAPELLGNKKYGPKVDIWSIGVNMYAMLTGNLPFTVEPFNIKALHNKMLKGDMNAIPETLSPECVDLLKQFLTADPESRISLANVMKHTWIIDGSNKPMEPAPFPNRLSSDHLDHDIIKHMASNMDYRMSDVIRLATNNIPNNATATYHLLLKKLTRYNEQVKAKGRSSSESRYTTPDSSKQAFRSGRRSAAAADVIRLTPVDKSHPRPPRRAVSQDFLRRQKSNTTDTQTKQKTQDSSQEDPSDTEKTLVRRKIQNARVLHRINGPLERKSPRKDKAETALKNEHLPIKGSDIKEEDEDEQDENIEDVEDEEEEEETVGEDRLGLKAIKGKKSPRLQRRYTDKLQVQEVITTALTPRSVHPAETVTTKMIGLPHIDKGDKAKPVSMSKTSENGSSSPRSMPRKVYPSFGYISKTKATAVSTAAHHQGNIRYGHKSPGEHSSNSTSSSRDGQKSTCSNPNPSTHQSPQHFAHSVENKGSVSDPSTKTEYKSINTPRPPAAKTVNIEMDSCDKYVRHNNTTAGTDLTHRPLPSVSPVRTLTQNRRVVNIVYPPFNKARGLSMRQQQATAAGRQAMSCDFESGNSLNITGEKALLGDAGHLLDTGRPANIDCIPLKARLTKVDTQTSDHHHQPDGPSLTSENTHKIVLPSLPMVETKAVNIT